MAKGYYQAQPSDWPQYEPDENGIRPYLSPDDFDRLSDSALAKLYTPYFQSPVPGGSSRPSY